MTGKVARGIWGALLLGLLVACAPPFRAPVSVRIPAGSPEGRGEAEGLVLHAALLSDEDAQWELFRANLVLSGLLPLHLEMTNRGAVPLELRRARLDVRDDDGDRLAVRTPRQALEQLFESYEVRTYRIAARRELEAQFRRVAFPFDSVLVPGETRRGIVFLALPGGPGPRRAPARLRLTLAPVRRVSSRESFAVTLEISPP